MVDYKDFDHVNEGLALLVEQFKNAAAFKKLLSVFLAEIQSIENVFCDIAWKGMLENADGATLDVIGAIAGEPRSEGELDASYRAHILNRIALNRSCGTAQVFIDALTAYGNVSHIEIDDLGGAVHIYTDNDYSYDNVALSAIKGLAAAGIGVYMLRSVSPPFRFKSVGGSDPDFGAGFGNVAGTIGGGIFAGLLIKP